MCTAFIIQSTVCCHLFPHPFNGGLAGELRECNWFWRHLAQCSALSKWHLLSGDWASAQKRREDGTYLHPMLTASFVHQEYFAWCWIIENLDPAPAFGGWLPAGDLCGARFGLVTEPASLSHASWQKPRDYYTPIRALASNGQQMCRLPGANKSFSGGPPGMAGPPGS